MKTLTRDWKSLDREQMREMQLRKARRYLSETVIPFSAHYRRVFKNAGIDPRDIRAWEDFHAIPFTSKSDLLGGPETSREFVIIPDEAVLTKRPATIARALLTGRARVKRAFAREFRPVMMTSTTGRSTEPIPFFYSQHDIDHLSTAGLRLMEICASSPDLRHLNLFPFAPHLAFWQAHFTGLEANAFILSTGGGKVMGTEGNVRLLAKIKPDVLIGMPTFVYHVLQEAVAGNIDCPSLKKIVLGGEKVPDGTRRKLRALCAELGAGRVDVMATYGFTEAKMAFPECPLDDDAGSGGYHLYPDLGIVEVIDPGSGDPVDDGEPGEITFTPLDGRGTVVLRYRTGDRISGGLVHEPCPNCGRILPRLVGRISRVCDVRSLHIDKIKGTLVNFNDLEHALDDMDEIGTWQIEIRKRNDDPLECDELTVHVATARRVRNPRDLERRIAASLQATTEIRPNHIEFHDAAALRRMHGVGVVLKEEKVVDHRPDTDKGTAKAPAKPRPVKKSPHIFLT